MEQKGFNDTIKIDVLLSNIQKKFNLSAKEVVELFKEKKEKSEIVLPLSIFNEKLGMLEAASLYLRDNLRLSFSEIAKLLKRDYKTIWASYNKARKKVKDG
jgi:predicted DNA-binding protein (UPF0251 family)